MHCTDSNATVSVRSVPAGAELADGGWGILLVEDERLVREVTSEVLAAAGYVVWAARDATEAVRLFRKHEAHVGLLITDVMLPDRSGPVLAGELLGMGGMFRTILTSGYPALAPSEDGDGIPDFLYLPKPFSAELLVRKVRHALDQATADRAESEDAVSAPLPTPHCGRYSRLTRR
jgi:two-component system cell cycle sensor histidine kinase/response regulator CckA